MDAIPLITRKTLFILISLIRVGRNFLPSPTPELSDSFKTRSVVPYTILRIEVVGITLSREVADSPRYKSANRYTFLRLIEVSYVSIRKLEYNAS